MDGSKELEFSKYKEKLSQVYPHMSAKELEEYFELRVKFWRVVIN